MTIENIALYMLALCGVKSIIFGNMNFFKMFREKILIKNK